MLALCSRFTTSKCARSLAAVAAPAALASGAAPTNSPPRRPARSAGAATAAPVGTQRDKAASHSSARRP